MARILLADDEDLIISLVRHCLRRQDHEVFIARDGVEALAAAHRHNPDLVVLDIAMPRMDGLKVCERLREDPKLSAIPILFLTGRGAINERVKGLDAGADDYLPKPFDTDELEARVRALLRRHGAEENASGSSTTLIVGDLELDLLSRELRAGDGVAELTPIEMELLHYLMVHPGETFAADHLLQEVWGYHPGTGDTSLVRRHVKKLRAKIEPDPANPRYLKTAGRRGYILVTDA